MRSWNGIEMNQWIGLAAHHPVGVHELAIFIEVGSSSNSLALAEALIEPWLCNRGVDVTGGYKMRITKASNNMAEDHGKEDTHVFQIEVATVTVSGVNENLFNSEYTALEETPKQNTHHSLRFNHREGTAGSFKRPSFAKIPLQLSLPFTTSTFQPCSGLPNSLKCWCPILQESTGMAAIILQPICNCITMSYSLLIWYVHICSTTRANWPTYIAQFEECC